MKTNISYIAAVLGAGLAMAAGSVHATVSWNLYTANSCKTDNIQYGSCEGTSAGGVTLSSITAYSDTGPGTGDSKLLAAAQVGRYGSNLGVTTAGETTSSPQHALDNFSNFESLLLTFSSAVTLSQVTLGWSQNDSDISVLAYQPVGSQPANPTSGMTSVSYGGLLNAGWNVVGNYANVGSTTTKSATVNSGSYSSSYWLIAAYNSAFSSGGCRNAADTANSTGCTTSTADYIKLLSVSGVKTPGNDNGVPEPSGLLLLGTALVGMIGLRRREKVVGA